MNRAIRYVWVFLLSGLIILGSGRFTLGKMICIESGQIAYSIGKAKDCCEKNGSPEKSLTSSCCDLVNVSFSLDDFSPSSKPSSASPTSFFIIPVFDLLPLTSGFSQRPLYYSDLPPPDTKGRLYSFRSLLL